MSTWVTVERVFNQPLGRFGLDAKSFRGFFDFYGFVYAGGPSKILGF